MICPSHQLILCSSFARCVDMLVAWHHIQAGNYRVGIIKNAADFYKQWDNYPWRVIDDIDALKKLWYTLVDIDLTTTSPQELAQELSTLDAIFITWGNSFWLLECMIHSGFRSIIKDYISQWLKYISTSAWSCVTTKDITYIQYVDDPKVSSNKDYWWLWLLPIAIKPHFSWSILSENYLEVYRYIYTTSWHNPLVTLNDHQAILGNINGTIQVLP